MTEPKWTYISPEELLHDSWRLARQVRDSQWRPDLILGLWRGGAPVAVAVHELLKFTGWPVDHLPLRLTSYTGIRENDGAARFAFADAIVASLRPGMKVLVVDDIFDTGKSAAAVTELLRPTGAEVRLACVYFKPANNRTALRPDYFVRDGGDKWIFFPHELEGLERSELAEKDPFLAELLA